MKRLTVPLAALGVTVALIVGFSARSTTRIGIYDSRAIAIAFGNSSEGMEFVRNLRHQMSEAKAAKNDSLIGSLENTGNMYQVLNHLRAFSSASVSEILSKHTAGIELVAKEARVQVIVSKFELIYSDAEIDTVDVTLPLVRLFKPREEALKWIYELPKHKPLPMLEVLAIPPER
jgi:hypothetical protein